MPGDRRAGHGSRQAPSRAAPWDPHEHPGSCGELAGSGSSPADGESSASPRPLSRSFSSVGDEVMVTDTNTDGQSSARDTKCVFIIRDFCCDRAASAEVQSPDVEILQPVAFLKEKGNNQDCPWVKNSGCRATQPTLARRTEDRGCQVCPGGPGGGGQYVAEAN